MLSRTIRALRQLRHELRLPAEVRAAGRRDRRVGLGADPGIGPAVAASLDWLARAQDMSATADGGVARDFSLIRGWAPSYPETTGYIAPTFLSVAASHGQVFRMRARRMLDWLVSIQFPEGGFQGSVIGASPVVPVTFNTGQVLLGLAAGAEEFGAPYRTAMSRAADWLARTQDLDGCWRSHPTPFAEPGEKAYETHVSWGLFEACRVERVDLWETAARRNVDWALTLQTRNGWFARNDLSDPEAPLTHTIGYVLRGVLEAHLFTGEQRYLTAAVRCAEGALSALRLDGHLAGRLDADWKPAVAWACLTGSVQIAHSWLILYELTGDRRFLDAGRLANAYVRRTVSIDGNPDLRGGVRGSFPISGQYGAYEYLNWAAKFFIDANLKEHELEA